MTVIEITQLIVAIAAAGALGVSVYTAVQVRVVHIAINSRMTELLELTQKASRAEGVKQEQERDLQK